MSSQLAIVIPAYKIKFLAFTLDSIVSQTCKDFTLYVGNDNSPSDIKALINEYTDRINIIYKEFDINLGGTNLLNIGKGALT